MRHRHQDSRLTALVEEEDKERAEHHMQEGFEAAKHHRQGTPPDCPYEGEARDDWFIGWNRLALAESI